MATITKLAWWASRADFVLAAIAAAVLLELHGLREAPRNLAALHARWGDPSGLGITFRALFHLGMVAVPVVGALASTAAVAALRRLVGTLRAKAVGLP